MTTDAQVYKALVSEDERIRLSAESKLIYEQNGETYIGSQQLMKLFRHQYEMAQGIKA